ncbi:hypothetical protein DFQ27_007755 [Actinomortierella ambigua]|uniref:ABC transporter domain-containing protein n=1 Tax=Actinomortierella ambigua TaxID=1343610 RepID=A0A9P6QKZ9_9FUNG|nr:hypothetical protein DFQ27_007755 [Actinomortierella ambigua]
MIAIQASVFMAKVPAAVSFDDDVRDYLSSILESQQFDSLDQLREETEHFMIDGGLEQDSKDLNDFYASLAGQFQDTRSNAPTKTTGSSLLKLLPTSTASSTAPSTPGPTPASGSVSGTSDDDDDNDNDNDNQCGLGIDQLSIKDAADSNNTAGKKKSKPVKMSKAAKKLAQKSGSASSTPKIASRAKMTEPEAENVTQGNATTNMFDFPVVEAFSQQSRFHSETFETLSKDVDLKQVNLIIADRPLITDTRLWLKAGTMYGLVGRNGTGKSTLLKAIGYGQLIGFPQNLRTLYIEQLPAETPGTQTVVETVLKADKERELLLSELKLLQDAINKKPRMLVKTIKRIQWDRKVAELDDAHKIAFRRSGKRGAEARERLLVIEAEEKEARQVYDAVSDAGQDPPADIVNTAHEMLENVMSGLQQIESDSAEARAREILKGLGFSKDNQDLPINKFSGGWRMRIALAQALFLKPDLLLLDEPTNHLDLPAIIWLQNYLLSEIAGNQTVVVVSHDRSFLNTVSEEIIRLRDQKLTYHPGNYDEYEMKMEDKAKMKDRIMSALEKKRKHVQDTISKQRQIMNKTGDDKRGAMIASRKKKLDRLQGHYKTDKGFKFKQSYHAGYHDIQGVAMEREQPEPPVTIPLPEPRELRIQASTLVSLNNVTYAYPGSEGRKTGAVIQNVSLALSPSSRVALLGPNGCGKSTLMGLLSGELIPTSGTVERASSLVKIGYFSQHNVDKLDGFRNQSAMTYLMEQFPEEFKTQPTARKYLGSFGVAGPRATLPMSTLSGGEKARVALAICVFGGPQVLLLDEITNHLDMATIEGLVVALKGFTGAVVLVSHDAYFVKQVCENPEESDMEDEEDDEMLQDEEGVVFRVKDGGLKRLEGGVDEYVATVIKENKKKKNKIVLGSSGRPV